ncbi:MAG: hypothetical protein ACRDU0_20570 [Mycobacterium sp.]
MHSTTTNARHCAACGQQNLHPTEPLCLACRKSTTTAHSAPNVITAKFSGRCPVCRQRIQKGERVLWSAGSQATHQTCAGHNQAARPNCPCSRNEACPRCQSYCYGECHTSR